MTDTAHLPHRPLVGFFLLAVLLLATPAAMAQAIVPADRPPAGSPQVVPEKVEPDRPVGAPPQGEEQDDSLSDELSRTGGVIEPPPAVDPEIVEPPPDDGSAAGRVIRPPLPPGPD